MIEGKTRDELQFTSTPKSMQHFTEFMVKSGLEEPTAVVERCVVRERMDEAGQLKAKPLRLGCGAAARSAEICLGGLSSNDPTNSDGTPNFDVRHKGWQAV